VVYPSRRTFLGTLATLMPAPTLGPRSKSSSEPVYRISTADCEIEMSVHSYGKVASDDLGFLDRVTNRRFCVSAKLANERNCVSRFTGALAVALYRFRSQTASRVPDKLRERVVTIDHDVRIAARPPFEELVAVEQDVASDIQAFGYNPDEKSGMDIPVPYASPWCIMRQDLYLDEQPAPFLIVHWKHTLESITLMDVIPGDHTRLYAD
jgi:hypothetical protein